MSETDYNTLLHEKMKQEYNEFIEELKFIKPSKGVLKDDK